MRALFSTELRRLLAYRFDFWVQFLGVVAVQFATAYFLWSAVFRSRGVETISGYRFDELMFYYLLVPLIDRLTRGFEMFQLSREIYEGALTRYLMYPVSIFGFKLVAHAARMLMSLLQLIIGLLIYAAAVGIPDPAQFSLASIFMTLSLCVVATVCYFYITVTVELIAFWADNVWSLLVLLRFVVQMLGGGLLPLEMYPDWAREALLLTPFPYFVAVPVRAMMGDLNFNDFVRAMAMITVWAFVAYGMARLIWRTGAKRYSGVGI